MRKIATKHGNFWEKKQSESELCIENNGVNLIGYLTSEQGLGEGARITARCLDTNGIDYIGIDFEEGNNSRQEDDTLIEKIQENIKYDISILNINPNVYPTVAKNIPKETWNTYKIGIWYWELPVAPAEWVAGFRYVDEIWAPTQFIKETFSKVANCPVLYMPPGIEKKEVDESKFNRDYFSLPNNTFLFLSMFDMFSTSGRKNPEAAVKAFKKAFASDDMSVGLVLKINNSNVKNSIAGKLKALIGKYKNIYLIEQILSRDEVDGLINTCDSAISLHRSEGLGLLCMESMYYGKATIATGWSGNIDFMNENNSCLVDYSPVRVEKKDGPYEEWQWWVEPDWQQAAEYMKKLVKDKDFYNSIATSAKRTIRELFSPQKCGEKMRIRLEEIQKDNEIKREHQKSDEEMIEISLNICLACLQKCNDIEFDEEEIERIKASWKKKELIDFNKIAYDLSKTRFVKNVGAKKFVSEFYSMLLNKRINVFWREYLIIISKRYGRKKVIKKIMSFPGFMGRKYKYESIFNRIINKSKKIIKKVLLHR